MCSIYLDDILVTGTSDADYLNTMDKVLTLTDAGLHLKQYIHVTVCWLSESNGLVTAMFHMMGEHSSYAVRRGIKR